MALQVSIEKYGYILEFDKRDPFVSPAYDVAFCDALAKRYQPIILDPKGYGQTPVPPEFMAYRMVHDNDHQRLCLIYEIYWAQQDCQWRQFNKDHDHDYEQIQLHFNLQKGTISRVAVASAGPPQYGGHGIEVYHHTVNVISRAVRRKTGSFNSFPWGRHNYEIWVLYQPIHNLVFQNKRVVVRVSNCFHVFTGIKWNQWQTHRKTKDWDNALRHELDIPLIRLDRRILWKWYYQHRSNQFGHDLSDPFTPPYILYYPSPKQFLLRFSFTMVGFITSMLRTLTGR